jgi:hypothetical protein
MTKSISVSYNRLLVGFIIISIIGSIITSIVVETRLSIKMNNNNIVSIGHTKFRNLFNYTDKTEPQWFKVLYNSILSIFITLFIYNIFLIILGKDLIYRYFFGNILY